MDVGNKMRSDYEEIFSDLLSGKFQKTLSLKLKKIYPLSLCEIKDIYIVDKNASENEDLEDPEEQPPTQEKQAEPEEKPKKETKAEKPSKKAEPEEKPAEEKKEDKK